MRTVVYITDKTPTQDSINQQICQPCPPTRAQDAQQGPINIYLVLSLNIYYYYYSFQRIYYGPMC